MHTCSFKIAGTSRVEKGGGMKKRSKRREQSPKKPATGGGLPSASSSGKEGVGIQCRSKHVWRRGPSRNACCHARHSPQSSYLKWVSPFWCGGKNTGEKKNWVHLGGNVPPVPRADQAIRQHIRSRPLLPDEERSVITLPEKRRGALSGVGMCHLRISRPQRQENDEPQGRQEGKVVKKKTPIKDDLQSGLTRKPCR